MACRRSHNTGVGSHSRNKGSHHSRNTHGDSSAADSRPFQRAYRFSFEVAEFRYLGVVAASASEPTALAAVTIVAPTKIGSRKRMGFLLGFFFSVKPTKGLGVPGNTPRFICRFCCRPIIWSSAAASQSVQADTSPLHRTQQAQPGRGGLAFWNLIKFNQFLNCGPFNLPWGPYTGEASTPRKDVRGFSFA